MTPFLWAFEERENLMGIYEQLSGARMHAAYIRPGGVMHDINQKVLHDIKSICKSLSVTLNDIDDLLSSNRIWKQRLVDIGVVYMRDAINYAYTGVMLRGSGLNWDLRKREPYEIYNNLSFDVPVGSNGDCYDRYVCRINEIRQSVRIIQQCTYILGLNTYESKSFMYPNLLILNANDKKLYMEELINHFQYWSRGFFVRPDQTYVGVEAPKGEFGCFLVSDGSTTPYRCRMRAPGFSHLHGLDMMVRGHMLADAVTIIGTQDIVLGELDR